MEHRIQLLDSKVVDQIAAGEVVERPSHLVKELMENSLDAGASEVSVEISDGGRSVLVSDNGRGIHPEDLRKALDRHATSKILSSEDLWKLNTFGFRGEALASIAAVSRLTLSSRPKAFKLGQRLQSEFGQVSSAEEVGHEHGTSVRVQELFANVPARLKFLRSGAAEITQIKNVFKAMALSHPQATFKLLVEGELIFSWSAVEGRLQRAEQVFELNLFSADKERDGVKVFAAFGDPHQPVRTSKQIWVFVQNRWVQDRSLQTAVTEAYQNLLMHGEYPVAAVWVELDPAQVDVNIHPTKSQVKFADPSVAFRAVHSALRSQLEFAPWLKKETMTQEPRFETPNLSFADPGLERTQFQKKDLSMIHNPSQVNRVIEPTAILETVETSVTLEKANPFVRRFEQNLQELRKVSSEPTPATRYWSLLQILGQADQTYILCQSREGLVIVDQHAAHERVNFEKLMRLWQGQNIDIQEYLFPLTLDLSADKVEALEKESEQFRRLGLGLERLGPSTIGIKSAPTLVKETALIKVLEKVAEELITHGASFSFEKLVGDLCATMACHSSIRAGQALSADEMRSLLVAMDEFPLSSFCPHGRPVSVQYPFAKLEKEFGRTL